VVLTPVSFDKTTRKEVGGTEKCRYGGTWALQRTASMAKNAAMKSAELAAETAQLAKEGKLIDVIKEKAKQVRTIQNPNLPSGTIRTLQGQRPRGEPVRAMHCWVPAKPPTLALAHTL